MSSFNDWDLSDLTNEEQQYFWSAIQKTEDQMDVYEMSAYNKAASRNIAGANSTGKAGFLQDPKDFQRQAAMYSVPGSDGCAITLLNPDPRSSHTIAWASLLAEAGGTFGQFASGTY